MENAMTDLNPEDEALLDLARDGHEPTGADRGRVRTALIAQLGIGTGLAVSTAVATSAASTMLVTKLITAVVVVVAIGGGALVVARAGHAPRAPEVAASPAAASEQQTDIPRFVAPSVVAPAPLANEALASAPMDGKAAHPSAAPPRPSVDIDRSKGARSARPVEEIARPVLPSPSGVSAGAAELGADPFAVPAPAAQNPQPDVPPSLPVPPAPPTPTTLEAETRLVRAGVAALHAGDSARALALFDEHARSYPNGILAEERAAERVAALCDLGRDAEARTAAAAFLRDHPRSTLSARVQASCGARSNP
jgi:hypothetical protein